MEKTKYYLQIADVMNIIGCKRTKASLIIRKLNEELRNDGYITIDGIVPASYFASRMNIPFDSITDSSAHLCKLLEAFLHQNGKKE